MKILGIETSCDETAAAVVEDGVTVLGTVISSASARYKDLAGVIPEDAARKQMECIVPVIDAALNEAKIKPSDIDVIAVTRGPGLLGSLLVGTMTARVIALAWGKPLVGVHHTLGHLASVWPGAQDAPQFPALTLSISGGHTDLWLRTSHLKGRLLGRTRDDAVGEAFDKGASILGLPYPGGPSVAKAAVPGDPQKYAFPRPLLGEDGVDFSFSGLKTALRYLLRDLNAALPLEQMLLADVAASYQDALCVHLITRVTKALEMHPDVKELHVVGGVSASVRLRELLKTELEKKYPNVRLRLPSAFAYCTDNAAMIASAAFFQIQEDPECLTKTFDTEATASLADVVKA